jgi:putative spermidine/putrescine transport system substrate-binding protein
MLFIKTVTQPEYQARLAPLTYFGPMNPKALPLIDPNVRKFLPTEPANLANSVEFNNEWWGENEAKLIERWNKWLLKK